MKIENKRLNERILNFNESVKRRNEVAEYYFEHGIQKTMEHFELTKQGVYSDVRAYKKFMGAYNLISNVKSRKDFLDIKAKEISPLFNNPRVGNYFNRDCKIKEMDLLDNVEANYRIHGVKSLAQFREFVKKYLDMIEENDNNE